MRFILEKEAHLDSPAGGHLVGFFSSVFTFLRMLLQGFVVVVIFVFVTVQNFSPVVFL
jgi:hypothetical protein